MTVLLDRVWMGGMGDLKPPSGCWRECLLKKLVDLVIANCVVPIKTQTHNKNGPASNKLCYFTPAPLTSLFTTILF